MLTRTDRHLVTYDHIKRNVDCLVIKELCGIKSDEYGDVVTPEMSRRSDAIRSLAQTWSIHGLEHLRVTQCVKATDTSAFVSSGSAV